MHYECKVTGKFALLQLINEIHILHLCVVMKKKLQANEITEEFTE